MTDWVSTWRATRTRAEAEAYLQQVRLFSGWGETIFAMRE